MRPHLYLLRSRLFGLALLAGALLAGGTALPSRAQPGYTGDQVFTSDAPANDDNFGGAVAQVGTMDGDRVFVVGAPGAENTDTGRLEGLAYLVNGSTGAVISSLVTRSTNSTEGGEFGAAVGRVGDVTGDGAPDVVVGAPSEDVGAVSNAGNAYVFDGSNGDYVMTLQAADASNIETGRQFGAAVTGIGDVTGDDVPDLVVGAPGQGAGGAGVAGKVYVFSGADGSEVDVLTGAEVNGGRFGASVARAGDLVGDGSNGADGTADFALGAPGEDTGGQGYLVDGSTIGGTVSTTTFDSGTNIEIGGKFGATLAPLGSGDNRDLVVGAPAEDGGGTNDAGRAYVIDGATIGGTVGRVPMTSGEGESLGQFGTAVAGIGDRTGDGQPDVIVGAPFESVNGTDDAGRAYVLDSSDGAVLATLTSPSLEDGRFGTAVVGAGQPVVGAPREDVGSNLGAGRIHTLVPTISFVDGRDDANGGDDFTGSPTPGTDENAVGRFRLSAAVTGTVLDAVTVSNDASTTASDVNAIELWASSDDTFDGSGTDTELASTSYADNVTFDGFGGQPIPSGDVYLFVVMDLAADASSSYEPLIPSEADLTLSGGPLAEVNGTQTSTFTNAYLSSGATALPVELTRLEATASSNGVALEWRTASEQNNAGFRVQRRSIDGTSGDWSRVGRVDGSGTTSSPQTYRFADDDLPAGADTLQYRLAQVDLDGSVNLSDPVTVGRGAPSGVKLLDTYPNPARTRATVSLAVPEQASGDATLQLYDVLGRQVRTVDGAVEPGRSTVTVDVSGLPSGVYVLRLAADGTTRTRRLTVVK